MRIAVATDDGRAVATHTGRCRAVVVFDVDGGIARRVGERPNTFTGHYHHGGDGGHGDHRGEGGRAAHAALIEAIADCSTLIARGMGARLMADLTAHAIDPFVSTVDGVDEAAGLFARGRLPRVEHAGCDGRS